MLWRLSFTDPKRDAYLGTAFVQAGDVKAAVIAASFLGCHPGGQVHGERLAAALEVLVCEGERARLLDADEVRELDDRFERALRRTA